MLKGWKLLAYTLTHMPAGEGIFVEQGFISLVMEHVSLNTAKRIVVLFYHEAYGAATHPDPKGVPFQMPRVPTP